MYSVIFKMLNKIYLSDTVVSTYSKYWKNINHVSMIIISTYKMNSVSIQLHGDWVKLSFIKDSLKEIETGLKNYILQELDQKIIQSTKDEINSLLEDFNTDQIKVVTAGNTEQTLTDYLKEIQNKLNNAESTSSKIKFDTPITVNIGEGNSIGGFNDGDIITKDITLQEFTTKLLTIAKTLKQYKCLINRWIDKEDVVHIYIMGY